MNRNRVTIRTIMIITIHMIHQVFLVAITVGDLMKLSSVNQWTKIFIFPHAKPEDSNELFQKLLEDLKELAEYGDSPSKDHPIFNNDEEHSYQNKEHFENSSNEIVASNSNQEKEKPPKDFDIRKLIREECCLEVCEEQK
uniref:Uncharacterized protein n=1 Tax=Tanacetum cinerariifolium TaxID=118510 RepID=A0A699QWN0_TANCI|nr:hypothetical protein [Tanacetum cinerariifolium]